MPVAVLVSGGLDSLVLAAWEAQSHGVQPIYVSCGLPWEPIEQAFVARFLTAYRTPHAFLPLARLEVPVRDIYPDTHWAIRGVPPGYDTDDREVQLVGRNIMLLAKAGIYCSVAGLTRIVVGQLQGNPFPDATPEFFAAMARALSLGLAHEIEIATPFAAMDKSEVIRLGVELGVPLELTLSCMNPRGGLHCGQCSKCRERRDAFHEAGVDDPTSYAVTPIR